MRWHATRESVDEGEVSALAIAETLVAVAVLVMLSFWFDTLKWLASASCLAPLLLLRTDDSVRKGLRWMRWVSERERGEKWIPKARIASAIIVVGICVWIAVWVGGWWAALIIFALISPVFLLPFSLAYLPVLCFCLRLGATLGSVLRHPLQSLGAIPGNWRRIVLGTDTTREPEFMPGDEFGPLTVLRGLPKPGYDGILYVAAVFLYVPTVAYRWSLKATCMIYMPLIWLVEAGRLSPNLPEALDDYQASDLRRIGTLMSLWYIAALAVKVILLMTVAEFVEWWDGNRALQFLKIYIVPHQVPLWQIASALNAVLAIILWVYARHVLRLIGKKKGRPSEGRVRAVWQTAKAITVVLALYSIACTIIITCKEGHLLDTFQRLWSVTGKQWLP